MLDNNCSNEETVLDEFCSKKPKLANSSCKRGEVPEQSMSVEVFEMQIQFKF